MKHADPRPRVHLWRDPAGVAWSIGPVATRQPANDHGAALNASLEQLGKRAAAGVVVIVEPTL